MTDFHKDNILDTIELDFETDPCLDINEGEARSASEDVATRAAFTGLLGSAPGCSTFIVDGLSQQLIHQMNLIVPDALVSFDDLKVNLGDAAYPFVQPPAKEGLHKAIQERGISMTVNSAYRTIAQQLLLFRWGRGCGYSIVAAPGRSNHQSGLAIDIQDHNGWKPFLERQGWRWLGPSDPPHFDYVGAGKKDLRSTAMSAIQKLWNKNHPTSKIDEDGDYGPDTESALTKSPVMGFAIAPWDEQPRLLRLSRPMMRGSDVVKLQQKLNVGADGVFGPNTAKAVREFQQAQGLSADGMVGPNTWGKLA